jgi:hypothetical protein
MCGVLMSFEGDPADRFWLSLGSVVVHDNSGEAAETLGHACHCLHRGARW